MPLTQICTNTNFHSETQHSDSRAQHASPAGALDLTDLKGQQLNLVLDLKHTLSQANKLISLCSL